MNTELIQALERVARRDRRVRLWSILGLCWLAWGLIGVALVLTIARTADAPLPLLLAIYLGLAVATGILGAAFALRSGRDRRWVARRIEARHPELGTGLLAAIEVDANRRPVGESYLRSAVIREALAHRHTHDWDETVPTWAVRCATTGHLMALGLLGFVAFTLASRADSRPFGGSSLTTVAAAYGLLVEPGNVELERGGPLLVVARFGGVVPGEVSLVVTSEAGTEFHRVMTRSLRDPTFAARLSAVDADLTYRVEFDGSRSETYRVRVFEHPAVVRVDAGLVFPDYTAIDPRTVEDIRHVTAIEGTRLTLTYHLNKPVASAQVVDREGRSSALSPADREGAYQVSFTLSDSMRLRAQLVDYEGRSNKDTTEIAVSVTRNRPPAVKITRPARDTRVSPVEELTLAAEIEDDFGVTRHGLSYTLAGNDPNEIVLGDSSEKSTEVKHLLAFESFQVEPDQLVTYHVWAEDIGPDGQPRRTYGDMFFAEVRPFEEIFRQGEQPPGGAQQGQQGQAGANAQQAMELAELQKEIINATWALIRRENRPEPSDTFAADAAVLLESQQSAIAQAAELAENLEDPESKANLDQATEFMRQAEARLNEAATGSSIPALTPALASEQAAYQALLKLRDREFNIVRGNPGQQQGGRSSSGPSQRQLQQLELSNDQNRYEEQRSAQAQQETQEQREDRQVLNRLRELARRQADLNERLKELQSALQAADDEETRAELERQLKRLRDQERQILRDTDELRERMEREENRDRMAEAREQVDQTRENLRRATEALEEGQLSQALTEGTRANRQLEELREELRRDASNRFTEELTEMRDQARQLAETQNELTEQLTTQDEATPPSLRGDERLRQASQGLEQQREQLEELLDRMRGTVREAEETEPRMAGQLFDAVREADEQSIPEVLEAAERLTELGIAEEAARASRQAARGLERLREGVERAAESVLGDETAALRLAQSELEDLAEQLDREIAQSRGQEPGDGEPGEGESSDSPRQPRDGENAAGEPGESPERSRSGGEPREPGPDGRRGSAAEEATDERSDGGQESGEPGEPSGQPESPQDRPGQGGQPGEPSPRAGQGGANQGPRQGGDDREAELDRLLQGLNAGGPGGPGNPITGEGYREWSDRMRDVEELLDDPELRSEAARIRDRVRGAREEYRRHATEPDWTKLQELVADPIHELRDRVAEELRRRQSPDSLVPIDRDPVPPQYAESVRRYYERLGSGR